MTALLCSPSLRANQNALAVKIRHCVARFGAIRFIRNRKVHAILQSDTPPLAVNLINAGEVGSDKAIRITRGEDGKMTGAVSVALSS